MPNPRPRPLPLFLILVSAIPASAATLAKKDAKFVTVRLPRDLYVPGLE